MTTLRCIFFLFVPLIFSINSIAQNKPIMNLGGVNLNKYSFVLFGIKSPTDVERVEQSLLLYEGVLFAKSDFPDKTFTLVSTEKIDNAFIRKICNDLKSKTDKFKQEKIKVVDFLNQNVSEPESFQQNCNSGNTELDRYIETYLKNKQTKK